MRALARTAARSGYASSVVDQDSYGGDYGMAEGTAGFLGFYCLVFSNHRARSAGQKSYGVPIHHVQVVLGHCMRGHGGINTGLPLGRNQDEAGQERYDHH